MALLANREIKRSFFDLSHQKNFTCAMGKVYPVLNIPILPADTMKFSAEMIVRVESGFVAPVMMNPTIRLHWFFVPNRLVWTDWETWITESLAGGDSHTFPTVAIPTDGFDVGSVADYLNLPVLEGDGITVSALPFRGFAKIWNDWYRPAQKSGTSSLVALKTIDLTDGADTTTFGIGKTTTPPLAAWEKDYFTSCLLTPQAKATAVTVPLGTTAPVLGIGIESGTANTTSGSDFIESSGTIPAGARIWLDSGSKFALEDSDNSAGNVGTGNHIPNIRADLSAATGISVNDLRWYSSLQRFFERLIKGTPRYTSFISTFFGVESSDQRLQRAELIGATKADLIISEVLSTNGASGGALGDLGGHGIAALRADVFEWSSEEHGYMFCCMTIRPRTQYFEGIPRDYLKDSADDFAIPEFALIGEQAVTVAELYAAAVSPTTVFGYQNRYAEYKSIPNSVNGLLRSTLNYWSFIRDFSATPTLNEAFLMCSPSVQPFVNQSTDPFVVQLAHHIEAIRPLPAQDEEYRLL